MYKLDLTLEEINKIMTALGNEPYVQVFELIGKVQTQVTPQLQIAQQSQEAEVATKVEAELVN